MAVIEAMLSGKSIVATRVGGIPELIVERVTGLLVEPSNAAALAAALQTLVDDPQLRARLGEGARAHALEKFSSARMAKAYLTTYGSPP